MKKTWNVYTLRDERGPGFERKVGDDVARYSVRAEAAAHVHREPGRALVLLIDGVIASREEQRADELEARRPKVWTVYRESTETEVAYIEAETAEEAKAIAEDDGNPGPIAWEWVMSDVVTVSVEA